MRGPIVRSNLMLPLPVITTGNGLAALTSDPAQHVQSRLAATMASGSTVASRPPNEGSPRARNELPPPRLDGEGHPWPFPPVFLPALGSHQPATEVFVGGRVALHGQPASGSSSEASVDSRSLLPDGAAQTAAPGRPEKRRYVEIAPRPPGQPARQEEGREVKRRKVAKPNRPEGPRNPARPLPNVQAVAVDLPARMPSNVLALRMYQKTIEERRLRPDVTVRQIVEDWNHTAGHPVDFVNALVKSVMALDYSVSRNKNNIQVMRDDAGTRVTPHMLFAVEQELALHGLSDPADLFARHDIRIGKAKIRNITRLLAATPLANTSDLDTKVLEKIAKNDRRGAMDLLELAGYSSASAWLSTMRQNFQPQPGARTVDRPLRSAILQQKNGVSLEFMVQNDISLAQAESIKADDDRMIEKVSAQLNSGTPIDKLDTRGVREGSESRVILHAKSKLIKDDETDAARLNGDNSNDRGRTRT